MLLGYRLKGGLGFPIFEGVFFMSDEITFIVEDEDDAAANAATADLVEMLRLTNGVEEVTRVKEDEEALDLGATVVAVISSGAALALARGLAVWLGERSKAKVTVITKQGSKMKTVIAENVSSKDAVRITQETVDD